MKVLNISIGTLNIPETLLYDQELKYIFVEEVHKKFASKNGVLYSADFKTLIKVPAELTAVERTFCIPEGVEEISNNAFLYCKLTSIQFPPTIKTIDSKALNGYIGDVDLSYAKSLSRIKKDALSAYSKIKLPLHTSFFVEQNGLSYITKNTHVVVGDNEVYDTRGILLHVFNAQNIYVLPECITQIADKAFLEVSYRIKQVVVNQNLRYFWNPYIENMGLLKYVQIPEDHPIFFKDKHGNIYSKNGDHPQMLVLAMQPANGILEILEGTEIIHYGACCRLTLKEVHFPRSLQIIRPYAFHRVTCENLDMSNTQLQSIQRNAFELAVIDKMVLPDTLKAVGQNTFAYGTCHTLDLQTTMVTSLPAYCFKSTTINQILIPNCLRTIETACFEETHFQDPELHLNHIKDVLKIEYGAFHDCNLERVFITSKAQTLAHSFDDSINVLRF